MVTGQPTTQTFSGTTQEISVSASYTPAGTINNTATTITSTGKLKAAFTGTATTITSTGKLKAAFTGTAGTVTVTGSYQKATGFSGTAATITSTSTEQFIKKAQ